MAAPQRSSAALPAGHTYGEFAYFLLPSESGGRPCWGRAEAGGSTPCPLRTHTLLCKKASALAVPGSAACQHMGCVPRHTDASTQRCGLQPQAYPQTAPALTIICPQSLLEWGPYSGVMPTLPGCLFAVGPWGMSWREPLGGAECRGLAAGAGRYVAADAGSGFTLSSQRRL